MFELLKKRFWLVALLLLLAPAYSQAAALSVTAANVVPDAGYQYEDGTAGATITAGQVVYTDSSSLYQLADADTSTQVPARGIALHGASANQPLRIMTGGTITIGATVVVGQVYTVSVTAGGIEDYAALASGDYVTLVGFGATATKLVLSFNRTGIVKP